MFELFRRSLGLLCLTFGFSAFASEPAFVPRAIKVTDNVYAIIGPLGQRSEANAGLNANYGFIIGTSGVILIDSGASAHSAAMLEKAVKEVTPKPIRWVLNTGSQDHRWLGNGYFASQGAEIHAMAGSVKTQQSSAQQQLDNLKRFVGKQLSGTTPSYATKVHPTPEHPTQGCLTAGPTFLLSCFRTTYEQGPPVGRGWLGGESGQDIIATVAGWLSEAA